MEFIKKRKSLPQNIDDIFFKEGAFLSNEYENLYSALFSKPDQYMRIVEALSTVNKGITRDEICEIVQIKSSGDLSKKLTELENCGFIMRPVIPDFMWHPLPLIRCWIMHLILRLILIEAGIVYRRDVN